MYKGFSMAMLNNQMVIGIYKYRMVSQFVNAKLVQITRAASK